MSHLKHSNLFDDAGGFLDLPVPLDLIQNGCVHRVIDISTRQWPVNTVKHCFAQSHTALRDINHRGQYSTKHSCIWKDNDMSSSSSCGD